MNDETNDINDETKHLGMVVEEEGLVVMALLPDTIKFISETTGVEAGDVVDITAEDNKIIIQKLQ